jgi:hypothetical protein
MSNKNEPNVQRTSIVPFGVFQSEGADDIALTVYQSGGLAVVREQRQVRLSKGANQVYLEGLPTQYQLNSLVVLDYEGAGELTLGPVSYRAANLDKARVLQASVGKPVTVTLTGNNGRVSNVGGTLRAVLGNELAVERSDNHRLMIVPSSQVELKELPAGLSSTPSLMMAPHASAEGDYTVGLLYEAGGLAWAARYFAFYDEKTNKLTRLEASVALTNRSGARFAHARVQLLAASNYAQYADSYGLEMAGGGARLMAQGAPMPKRAMAARAASVESVGDVKMYPLEQRVTIADGETQQVTLMLAKDVPVKREYFLGAGSYDAATGEDPEKLPVYVRLRLENKAESNLGAALPDGEVSILQPDSTGAPQKTFSTRLDAVAQGESFKLEFGPSADVKAQRVLVDATDYVEGEGEGDDTADGGTPEFPIKPLGGPGMPGDRVREIAREVVTGGGARKSHRRGAADESNDQPAQFREEERELTVHNYKGESVEVLVSESIPQDAEFLSQPEGHEFTADSNGSTVKVTVAANSSKTLRYRLRWQTN